MTYSSITLATALTDLGNRLGDPASVFYTQAEKRLYIKEALRWWGAVAQWSRGRFQFALTQAQGIYDLTAVANTLIPRTLTDRDLVVDIEYALMEPANATWAAWGGTEMFDLAIIQGAVQRRRDQFLLDTGCVLTNSEIVAPAPPASLVPISDAIIDVRRAAWKTTANLYSTLWRTDEHTLNAQLVGWQTNPETPACYTVYVAPPTTLQLGPVSSEPGSVNLITVNAGPTLNVAAGVLLGIPDDFAWAVKWGAIADLLNRDGQSADSERAQYAEARYQEGVAVARLGGTILSALIDGAQVGLISLKELDAHQPGWQTATLALQGTPAVIAMAGMNLMCLYPLPDSSPHSAQIDCVQNMPIPATDAAFLQIGKEQYSALLDYSCHLARFKEGGTDWQQTFGMYQSALAVAMDTISRHKANAAHYEVLQQAARREFMRNPMREEAAA